MHRGKAYGGKVLHNLKDTLKVSKTASGAAVSHSKSHTIMHFGRRLCSSSLKVWQSLSPCKRSNTSQSRCMALNSALLEMRTKINMCVDSTKTHADGAM